MCYLYQYQSVMSLSGTVRYSAYLVPRFLVFVFYWAVHLRLKYLFSAYAGKSQYVLYQV